MGLLSEKPPSQRPCIAWATDGFRGCRGYLPTPRKFMSSPTSTAAGGCAANCSREQKVRLNVGVLGDLQGFLPGNPLPTIPRTARAPGSQWGFRGLFLSLVKYYLFYIYIFNISNKSLFGKILNGLKRSIKSPKTPFPPPTGSARHRLAVAAHTSSKLQISTGNKNASSK